MIEKIVEKVVEVPVEVVREEPVKKEVEMLRRDVFFKINTTAIVGSEATKVATVADSFRSILMQRLRLQVMPTRAQAHSSLTFVLQHAVQRQLPICLRQNTVFLHLA